MFLKIHGWCLVLDVGLVACRNGMVRLIGIVKKDNIE